MKAALVSLSLFLSGPAAAVTLEFPSNASLAAEETEAFGRYDMPTGPWTSEGMAILSEDGEVRRQAWQIAAVGLTPVQILEPLQAQLEAAGFEVLFACQSEGCGGFDFRFATPVLPAPAMHVDLGEFLYLAAERPDPDVGTELVSLLISRSSRAGYVQVTRVGPPSNGTTLASIGAAPVRATATVAVGDFAQELDTLGKVILVDLAFETGSAQLGAGDFASLQKLADYLAANPTRTVALVGHTDSVGSLEGNIALSRRRAGSVLERLVTDYGVPRRQLEAQGMGYLAPIASNLTEEGREANRRVEVIVTSTE